MTFFVDEKLGIQFILKIIIKQFILLFFQCICSIVLLNINILLFNIFMLLLIQEYGLQEKILLICMEINLIYKVIVDNLITKYIKYSIIEKKIIC